MIRCSQKKFGFILGCLSLVKLSNQRTQGGRRKERVFHSNGMYFFVTQAELDLWRSLIRTFCQIGFCKMQNYNLQLRLTEIWGQREEGNYYFEDDWGDSRDCREYLWYNSEPWPVTTIVNGLASSSHRHLWRTKEKTASRRSDRLNDHCCRMAWPHKAYPLSLFHRRLDDLYAAVFPCLPHYMSQFRVEWSLSDGCAEQDWLWRLLAEWFRKDGIWCGRWHGKWFIARDRTKDYSGDLGRLSGDGVVFGR